MAEKLKQDILQPPARLIGTNETASSESTARNMLGIQKLGDKKVSPNSSIKTMIEFGQEYARLTALGDPNALAVAAEFLIPPAFIDERFLKYVDWDDPGWPMADRVFNLKPHIPELTWDAVNNPDPPADPVYELAPFIHNFNGCTLLTGEISIDIIVEVLDEWTVQYNAAYATADTTSVSTSSSSSGNLTNAIDAAVTPITGGYESVGEEEMIDQSTTTFKVNGVDKASGVDEENFSWSFDMKHTSDDDPVVYDDLNWKLKKQDIVHNISTLETRSLPGGGSLLALRRVSVFSAEIKETNSRQYTSGGSVQYTIDANDVVTESRTYQIQLNDVTLQSFSGSRTEQTMVTVDENIIAVPYDEMMLKEGGGLYVRNMSNFPTDVSLDCVWGTGSNNFMALVSITRANDFSETIARDVLYDNIWESDFFQQQPNYTLSGPAGGDPTYYHSLYLARKDSSTGLSYQTKLVFSDDTIYADSQNVPWFIDEWVVTNDYYCFVVEFLQPTGDSNAYYQIFAVERNSPFRIFSTNKLAHVNPFSNELYVWKRIA